MNEEFKEIIDQFPSLMTGLISSPPRPWRNLGSLPQKGIYVFYEDARPIYVGRSNRVKERIKEHGRPSSRHNSAPFAFNLAKKAAKGKAVNMSRARVELEKDPVFADLFSRAKERVTRMSVRVIEINDPIIQTLLEVYAAVELKTEFNDFNTH